MVRDADLLSHKQARGLIQLVEHLNKVSIERYKRQQMGQGGEGFMDFLKSAGKAVLKGAKSLGEKLFTKKNMEKAMQIVVDNDLLSKGFDKIVVPKLHETFPQHKSIVDKGVGLAKKGIKKFESGYLDSRHGAPVDSYGLPEEDFSGDGYSLMEMKQRMFGKTKDQVEKLEKESQKELKKHREAKEKAKKAAEKAKKAEEKAKKAAEKSGKIHPAPASRPTAWDGPILGDGYKKKAVKKVRTPAQIQADKERMARVRAMRKK